MSLLESAKFSLFRNLPSERSTNIRIQRHCIILLLAISAWRLESCAIPRGSAPRSFLEPSVPSLK